MSGDILDDIDAAIEEHEGYVEWHGSADSATWTADGSHEVARTTGLSLEEWQRRVIGGLRTAVESMSERLPQIVEWVARVDDALNPTVTGDDRRPRRRRYGRDAQASPYQIGRTR